ncbi:MAG TPA: tetratricopeptide repeat protein, partial [Spirochaetota bacterium]|nr:tetratricopeptide repeat protein [Spirochaetota bacterium]
MFNDRRIQIGIIAVLVLLLSAGAYFIFDGFKKDPLKDIENMRTKQIALYEELLETEPNNVEIILKIANAYKDIQDYDKAIDYYLKAIKIDPKNYDAITELGHAYALKGDYAKAIETYEKAKTV